MNLVDVVVLRRAEEQVRAVDLGRASRRERDPWAVPERAGRPEGRAGRGVCRAEGCGRRAWSSGMCTRHAARVRRGLPLDAMPGEPGRRAV